MRHGVDYFFPVKFRNFSVTLRPLSNSEMMEALSNAQAYIATVPRERVTEVLKDNFIACEILKMASRPFEEKGPGKLTELILQNATTEEVMFLYKQWMAITDKVNPVFEEIPIEVVKRTVEDVKKNSPQDLKQQLTELSFMQLVNLARYLLTSDESQTGR